MISKGEMVVEVVLEIVRSTSDRGIGKGGFQKVQKYSIFLRGRFCMFTPDVCFSSRLGSCSSHQMFCTCNDITS